MKPIVPEREASSLRSGAHAPLLEQLRQELARKPICTKYCAITFGLAMIWHQDDRTLRATAAREAQAALQLDSTEFEAWTARAHDEAAAFLADAMKPVTPATKQPGGSGSAWVDVDADEAPPVHPDGEAAHGLLLPYSSDKEYVTARAPFSPGLSFLGHDTNGAAPERVCGLFVTASVVSRPGPGGSILDEFYRVYVVKDVDDRAPRRDPVVGSTSLRDVEHLLRALVAPPEIVTVLPSLYGGYRNRAQLAHDDRASLEIHLDLSCRVVPVSRGFEMLLYGDETPPIVARLCAGFAGPTARFLTRELRLLRSWRDRTVLRLRTAVQAEAGVGVLH